MIWTLELNVHEVCWRGALDFLDYRDLERLERAGQLPTVWNLTRASTGFSIWYGASRLYTQIREREGGQQATPQKGSCGFGLMGYVKVVEQRGKTKKRDQAKARAAWVFSQRWNSSYFHKQSASCISKGLSPGEQRFLKTGRVIEGK